MGKLYEIKTRIDDLIKAKGLPLEQTRGIIGLKVGMLLSFVRQDTPDDEVKAEKLRKAVWDVLHEKMDGGRS
jgi:hypothetical protein